MKQGKQNQARDTKSEEEEQKRYKIANEEIKRKEKNHNAGTDNLPQQRVREKKRQRNRMVMEEDIMKTETKA